MYYNCGPDASASQDELNSNAFDFFYPNGLPGDQWVSAGCAAFGRRSAAVACLPRQPVGLQVRISISVDARREPLLEAGEQNKGTAVSIGSEVH